MGDTRFPHPSMPPPAAAGQAEGGFVPGLSDNTGMQPAGARPRVAGRGIVDGSTLQAVSKVEGMLRQKLEEKFKNIHQAFRGADQDGSGHIDVGEFKRILENVHHVQVPDDHMNLLLERFDSNGDGKVDFQEFSKWMMPGYFMVC